MAYAGKADDDAGQGNVIAQSKSLGDNRFSQSHDRVRSICVEY